MSGINTGAYPAGQNQDWEQIAIDATTLNGDLNALNQDVNELETNTDAIVDGYGTIIDNSTTVVAEGQVYRVNKAGIINASFVSMIQSTSTTPQTYSLSVIVASAGNSNIGSNSYGWLLPMSAPIVP